MALSKKKAGALFGAKLDFSNQINKILEKHGNKRILAIRIGRRPINEKVEKAFDIISLGKWSELRNKYYYDTLFHLFLIITLQDGTVVSLEKNSIVTMTENDSRCSMPGVECIQIEYPADSLSLDEFVKKPLERMGKQVYFIYDPFKQNCQLFVSEVLKTFGLLSDKAKEFIYQDITEIVERLPFYVKYIGKAVTDADATISKIVGAGEDEVEPMEEHCGMSIVERRRKKIEERKREDVETITDFVINEIIN